MVFRAREGWFSQDVTLATSHGAEMQCAQECSKAACGAFYVQVKLDSIRKMSVL